VRPSGELSHEDSALKALLWRELDTILIVTILILGGWVVAGWSGGLPSLPELARWASEFLGFTAPIFFAAAIFLVWVIGALLLDMSGLSPARRRWRGIAGGLFYVENAAPFVGLLECFISIVKALLAYSAAGATPQAQSAMIASIAVALGASAAGCFVALCAHSLRMIAAGRVVR
jgi:hypothetical protein